MVKSNRQRAKLDILNREHNFVVAQKKGLKNMKKAHITQKSPMDGRDREATIETNVLANSVNVPITPITCSGTSFKCDVAGSGKTPLTQVKLQGRPSDIIATPLEEGGIRGETYQPDFILNWQNNSIATPYTKSSLRKTYGFENFQ